MSDNSVDDKELEYPISEAIEEDLISRDFDQQDEMHSMIEKFEVNSD